MFRILRPVVIASVSAALLAVAAASADAGYRWGPYHHHYGGHYGYRSGPGYYGYGGYPMHRPYSYHYYNVRPYGYSHNHYYHRGYLGVQTPWFGFDYYGGY